MMKAHTIFFHVLTFVASIMLCESQTYSLMNCNPADLSETDIISLYKSNYPTINSPEIKVCHFKNMCFVDGKFHFYQPERHRNQSWTLKKYHQSFTQRFFTVGIDRERLLPKIEVNYKPLPDNLPFDAAEVGFWLGHSNAYNYGHYVLDTVMSAFIASQVFGLPFGSGRQLFESSCNSFGFNEGIGDRAIPFNSSMGTFRDACLERINSFWPYFFNFSPAYLEPIYLSNRCYRNVLVGMGTAFNYLRHLGNRAKILRDFREYLLPRLVLKSPDDSLSFSSLELIKRGQKVVLVALRSPGHSGKAIVPHLCESATAKLKEVLDYYQSQETSINSDEKSFFANWTVKCFVPQDVSFIEEISLVRNAPVLVSIQGTISFMSLFARDESHHIVLSDPRDSLKEYMTVFHSSAVHTHHFHWDMVDAQLFEHLQASLESLQLAFNVNTVNASRSVLSAEEKLLWSHDHRDVIERRGGPFYQMLPRDGIVLQLPRQRSLYLMVQGHRRLISNYDIYIHLGSPPIFTIRQHEFDAIPAGPDLMSSTDLAF